MKSFLSKKLVVAGVALVALGGAAGAVAATQVSGGPARQAYVDDLPTRLGVAPSALASATRAARDDRIDAAVAAGRLSAAQGAALKQRVAQRSGVPSLGRRHAAGLQRIARRGARVTARYLGISAATLQSDLDSGRSLAQIASSTPGKSSSGLKAALLAAATRRLDRAVAHGRISSAQEQTLLSSLPTRIDALLQWTWGSRSPAWAGGLRLGHRGGLGLG